MVELARDGVRRRGVPTEVVVGVAAVCVVAVLAATAVGGALVVVALLVAIGFAIRAVPRTYRCGALIGVALSGAVDGLPGPDLATRIVINGLHAQDFAIFLLIGLLAWEIYTHRLGGFFTSGLGKALLMFALLNAAWWVFELSRATGVPGVAVNHAANFARAFMFIFVLTPLFAAGLQRRATRNAMFVVTGAWTLVLSAVSIFGAVHQSSLTQTVLHVAKIHQTGALSRLYVHAEDLIAIALMFSIAFLFGSADRRQRRFAGLVTVFAAVAIGVFQTRAYYVGCIAGALISSVIYMTTGDSRAGLKRLVVALATLGIVIGGIFVVAPGSKTTKVINQITYRAASGIGAAGSQNQITSTVAVREAELQLLEQRLGNHWGLGLGFVDPRDVFDINLPYGSIENSDVGLFNVVMTEGVIGTVLYYLSLLLITLLLVVKSRALRGERRVYAQGALGACAATLVTSLTLVTFFGVTGIAVVAAAIGVGAATIQGDDQEARFRPDVTPAPVGAAAGVIP